MDPFLRLEIYHSALRSFIDNLMCYDSFPKCARQSRRMSTGRNLKGETRKKICDATVDRVTRVITWDNYLGKFSLHGNEITTHAARGRRFPSYRHIGTMCQ